MLADQLVADALRASGSSPAFLSCMDSCEAADSRICSFTRLVIISSAPGTTFEQSVCDTLQFDAGQTCRAYSWPNLFL